MLAYLPTQACPCCILAPVGFSVLQEFLRNHRFRLALLSLLSLGANGSQYMAIIGCHYAQRRQHTIHGTHVQQIVVLGLC